jgi:hypothetical protein
MTQQLAGRWLAAGDAGARETLAAMRRLVYQASADTSFVWWARNIVNDCPPRDENCNAGTIRDFVNRAVWFQRDPLGNESLTSPLVHLRFLTQPGVSHVKGDCDDVATLSAALGVALGMPATFTVLAFTGPADPVNVRYTEANAPYQHVYTSLLAGGRWREMDTTRPEALPASLSIARSLTVPL